MYDCVLPEMLKGNLLEIKKTSNKDKRFLNNGILSWKTDHKKIEAIAAADDGHMQNRLMLSYWFYMVML